MQIGGVYTTFCQECQEEGILAQKYRDRNGRCIAMLFRSVGVRGRCDSPDFVKDTVSAFLSSSDSSSEPCS